MNSVSAITPESEHSGIETAPPSGAVADAAVTRSPRQQEPFSQRFTNPF